MKKPGVKKTVRFWKEQGLISEEQYAQFKKALEKHDKDIYDEGFDKGREYEREHDPENGWGIW